MSIKRIAKSDFFLFLPSACVRFAASDGIKNHLFQHSGKEIFLNK
jgi:hypothetical protein